MRPVGRKSGSRGPIFGAAESSVQSKTSSCQVAGVLDQCYVARLCSKDAWTGEPRAECALFAKMAGSTKQDCEIDLVQDVSEESSGVSLDLELRDGSQDMDEPLNLGDVSSVASEASLEIPAQDGATSEEPDLLADVEAGVVDPLDAATERFLGRSCPLGKQAQLLIANVVSTLSGVSQRFLSSMATTLLSAQDRQSYSGKRLFWKVSSKLLGVTVYRVQSCHRRMKANAWQPMSPRHWLFGEREDPGGISPDPGGISPDPGGISPDPGGISPGPSHDVDRALIAIVRLALASVVEGMSFAAYERQLQRMRLSYAMVGTKYCDRRFVTEVIALSSLVLRQLDAYDYSQPLPGLGIPSDFAILADPVSIGLSVRARHDVLLVMCLCLVSRHTGTLYSPMFAAPPMPFGSHSGHEMAVLMLQALADHPAGWGLHALRSRCSSLCGDGGLCIGGPEHRHHSSDAVGKMWRMIHSDPVVAYPDGPPVSPPECCVWDPFHRADNAGWRAIRAVPLALQVFDVSKQLDALLAQSEGVILFRGVADQLDESPHAIRAPGGTRKIVYLSGTPSSIVENYRIITAALHGRVAWVQAGHRHQSLSYLFELGRTLSDPTFVTFTLLLSDILSMVVRPFAKQVQAACEPVVFQSAVNKLRKAILEGLMIVRRFRIVLRVVCLCRQHAALEDLRHLAEACLSQRGKQFAVFAAHISGIVLPSAPAGGEDRAGPLFKNTRLAVPPADHNRSQEMCLGAHCQCSAKIAFHRKLWTALCEGRVDRDDDAANPRPKVQVRGMQDVRVPVPVAYSPVQVKRSDGPLESISPRFTFLPRRLPALPNLDTTGMLRARIHFTEAGHVSRCQVAHSAYLVHDAVDEALSSGIDLLEKLNVEFDAILHSVGCNDDMSALLRCSAVCWDWAFLISNRPSVEHVRAFRTVVGMLRPLLIQTLYPAGAQYGGVSPHWPNDETLCAQYMLLAQRVRKAASGASDVPDDVRRAAHDWVGATQCEARPLWVNCLVEQLCRQCWPGLAKAHHLRLASVISCFAGVLPREACDVQVLPSARLVSLDKQQKRRRRSKRARSPSPLASLLPGHVAVCYCKNKRMLMYIEARLMTVDVSKVAAALDMLPWFSLGTGVCAWHATRVHHRCRLLFPPDSPCERMGSYMRLAWDQRQGRASPVYVSDRLYLMQAGITCLGSDRDEMIVRETCRLLESTSKYKMTGDALHSRLKEEAVVAPFVRAKDKAMAASGRFWGALPAEEAAMVLEPGDFSAMRGQGQIERKRYLKERAHSAKPMHLPEAVSEAVKAAVTTAKVVKPLPANPDILHALQRGAAQSVVQKKISSWLHSKEGLEWQRERKELLFSGDNDGNSEADAELAPRGSGVSLLELAP